MSILKFLGNTPEERPILLGASWEAAQLSELTDSHADDEVWLVCVGAKPAYSGALSAALNPPRSILWVPEGQTPLPFDDWWEDFAVQLLEARAEDTALLERVTRCSQVLDWAERVSDVPETWFMALTASPRRQPLDRLPFSREDLLHLQECEDCRVRAYDLLQQQADIHWASTCPDAATTGQWLESVSADHTLEEHVAGCGLCREMAGQQIRLWEETGLLTAAEALTKRSAIGLLERSTAPRTVPFLATMLSWHQAAQASMSDLAALLTQGLSSGMTLRAATRSSAPSVAQPPLSHEDLADRLSFGEPVSFGGAGRWLHVTLDDEDVLVRVGRSPTDRFPEFSVQFFRGDEVIALVEAEEGTARITPEHFAAARQGGADRAEVVTPIISVEGN